jgi:hypothetical protein
MYPWHYVSDVFTSFSLIISNTFKDLEKQVHYTVQPLFEKFFSALNI